MRRFPAANCFEYKWVKMPNPLAEWIKIRTRLEKKSTPWGSFILTPSKNLAGKQIRGLSKHFTNTEQKVTGHGHHPTLERWEHRQKRTEKIPPLSQMSPFQCGDKIRDIDTHRDRKKHLQATCLTKDYIHDAGCQRLNRKTVNHLKIK